MKSNASILILILGMMLFMPSFIFAKTSGDTLVINKVYDYGRKVVNRFRHTQNNVYIKYRFQVDKRNAALIFMPSMYSLAKGERSYLGETYSKITFNKINEANVHRHAYTTTIRHDRRTMPNVIEMLTPNVYDITLFKDKLLSPFNRHNKRFYKYHEIFRSATRCGISFTPRLKNTQLVHGVAIVDFSTGKIIQSTLVGNYDLIAFAIDSEHDTADSIALLPKRSNIKAIFSFMGNKISCDIQADYHCTHALPDALSNINDRQLISALRPQPLTKEEQRIYEHYDSIHHNAASLDTLASKQPPTPPSYYEKLKDAAWDIVDDNLLSSIRARNDRMAFRMSPLISPLSVSYSNKGLGYKLRFYLDYYLPRERNLTLKAQIGYNFRQKNLYTTIPLRFNYFPAHNGYLEATYNIGNRITNSSVLDLIRNESRDTINFEQLDLDYFKDQSFTLNHHYDISSYLAVDMGIIYHHRTAVNKGAMSSAGKPAVYNSFAPMIGVRINTWNKGPVMNFNYERALPDVLHSNMEYERWEYDLSYYLQLYRLRTVSLRIGGGLYTNQKTSYFVDFANFRDNNMPDDATDGYSGQFQLLDSRWYNASKYYLRTNLAYESPLICLSWMPYLGKYIETERLYCSALSIDHTRPYYELGYGFTSRYISFGMFCGALNTHIKDFGCKIIITLFSKW